MCMTKTTLKTLAAIAISCVLTGCKNGELPEDRLTVEPYDHEAMHRYYKPMYEAALAHDMSLADCHFFPHTTKLNRLGIRRLERMGPILEQYGGTVRYETYSKDEDAVRNRLTSVERYLADAGMDMKSVTVIAGLSGGRGMTNSDAIRAEDNFYESTLEEIEMSSGQGQ